MHKYKPRHPDEVRTTLQKPTHPCAAVGTISRKSKTISSMYFLRCTHNAFSSGAPHLTVLTTTRVVPIHARSLWKGSRRLGQILKSLTSLARCSFGHTAPPSSSPSCVHACNRKTYHSAPSPQNERLMGHQWQDERKQK